MLALVGLWDVVVMGGAQGGNVAWGAVTGQLRGRRLQVPLHRLRSGGMGGATLYWRGGWIQSFKPSWLDVTGTEEMKQEGSVRFPWQLSCTRSYRDRYIKH